MGELRRDRDVRLGLSIPTSIGAELDRALARCVEMGATTAEVHIKTLERVLGAPVPTVPLEPPPADGLAFGLLELEEDVLRDSYDLAKGTFDTQMRAWRSTVSLAQLLDLRQAWRSAGVSFTIVRIPDLVSWSDDETGYAFRLAEALGARVVATRASLSGPRRLSPLARRHGISLSFEGHSTAGASDLGRLLDEDDQIAVAIDFDTWTTEGFGSPLPFLREHGPRVSHVRLPAHDPMNDAHVCELLDAVHENQWTFGVFVLHHVGT